MYLRFIFQRSQTVRMLPYKPLPVRNVITTIERELLLARK
jgi:hypothetical protein